MTETKDLSIYIHIPFCEQKCIYCAFNSFCASGQVRNEYIDLLCKEIENRKVKRPIKTIYIGGGTPSVLTANQIEKIVKCVYDNFDVYEDAEFTIEANPNSISEELLKVWKSLRVNRLSIGVQSLSDKSLKKIGRLHDKKMAVEKIKLARHYFDNISADLIVGLEGETGKDLCSYAKTLLGLGVKHISCYLLEIYKNTKLYQEIVQKKYKPLGDEQMIDSFNKLANYLQDMGMERYEISNFAFPGYESRHNLNYWARGEYLGFGLSAHSYMDGKRIQNAGTISDYKLGKQEIEVLSKKDEIEEEIMLGLRCKLGVDIWKVKKMGYDITQNQFFNDYLAEGMLKLENDKLFLNPIFYHISNTIISNLFS